MSALFFSSRAGEFTTFSPIHLATLLFLAVLLLLFYLFRKPLKKYRRSIRLAAAAALLASRFSLDVWYVATGQWSPAYSLPLELCSISGIFCAVMLLTKNRFLFEVFYFLAVGGSLQAMLTPNLDYGFPHYRYIQFFFSHYLIFCAPLILLWLYRFPITRRAVFRSWLALHVLASIVFVVDLVIPQANYMFLMRKPTTPSLLDYLGPHPYYLLSLEVLVLFIFALLYAPFAFRNRQHNRDQ